MEKGDDVGGSSTHQSEDGAQIGGTSNTVKESTAQPNVTAQTSPNTSTEPMKPVSAKNSIVLDPRYKLRYVKFSFSIVYDDLKAEELSKRVNTSLIRLYEQYVKKDGGVASSRESEFYQDMDIDDEDDAMKAFAFQYEKHLMKEDNVENKSEIDRYFADDCEDPTISNFDILGWWKLNSTKYRILSQIARDVLAIPVSTVASESAFSTGGRVLDSFRSSLTPKMAEALICAQNWLRSSSKSIDLKEYMDDVENYEEIESEFDKGKGTS